jgi:hypothetical protein
MPGAPDGGPVSPNRRRAPSNQTVIEDFSPKNFCKLFCCALVARAVNGVLEVFQRMLCSHIQSDRFFEALGGQAAIAIDNATLLENLQTSIMN